MVPTAHYVIRYTANGGKYSLLESTLSPQLITVFDIFFEHGNRKNNPSPLRSLKRNSYKYHPHDAPFRHDVSEKSTIKKTY